MPKSGFSIESYTDSPRWHRQALRTVVLSYALLICIASMPGISEAVSVTIATKATGKLLEDFSQLRGQRYWQDAVRVNNGWISGIFTGQQTQLVQLTDSKSRTWWADILTNPTAPLGPLAISNQPDTGELHQNLVATDYQPFGIDLVAAGGGANSGPTGSGPSGIYSMLYDIDQSSFSTNIIGRENDVSPITSTVTIYFYDRAGNPITSTVFQLADLVESGVPNAGAITVTTDFPFAGVSLVNTDTYGVAYSNWRDGIPTPIPGTAFLLLTGPAWYLLRRPRRHLP